MNIDRRSGLKTFVFFIGLAAVFSVCGLSAATGHPQDPVPPGPGDKGVFLPEAEAETLLLVFLEFDDLLCVLCAESLLTLYQALPPHIQRERVWMMIRVDPARCDEKTKKIVLKKIEGFMRANGLCVPVSVDFSSLSVSTVSDGSFVLLLDGKTLSIRRYDFPLASDVLSQVLDKILR